MLKTTATWFNSILTSPKRKKRYASKTAWWYNGKVCSSTGLLNTSVTYRSTMSDANESYNTATSALIQYITFAEERNIEQGLTVSHWSNNSKSYTGTKRSPRVWISSEHSILPPSQLPCNLPDAMCMRTYPLCSWRMQTEQQAAEQQAVSFLRTSVKSLVGFKTKCHFIYHLLLTHTCCAASITEYSTECCVNPQPVRQYIFSPDGVSLLHPPSSPGMSFLLPYGDAHAFFLQRMDLFTTGLFLFRRRCGIHCEQSDEFYVVETRPGFFSLPATLTNIGLAG